MANSKEIKKDKNEIQNKKEKLNQDEIKKTDLQVEDKKISNEPPVIPIDPRGTSDQMYSSKDKSFNHVIFEFKHQSGMITQKVCKIGFSWTIFFWGPFALAIREEWLEALVALIIPFFWLIWLPLAIVQNKRRICKYLQMPGWTLSTEDQEKLKVKGIAN